MIANWAYGQGHDNGDPGADERTDQRKQVEERDDERQGQRVRHPQDGQRHESGAARHEADGEIADDVAVDRVGRPIQEAKEARKAGGGNEAEPDGDEDLPSRSRK